MHMDNHRGLTITAIMGKLIEHIIQIIYDDEYKKFNCDLQYGFTENKSPIMAILLLTEIINYAKTHHLPLYIATLDAQKAFDVVDHDQLKVKLFHQGIDPKLWCLLDDLYSNMTEVVKWRGKFSERYEVLQGVGQGRIPSAHMYKAHIKPHLDTMQRADIGVSIGPYYIGTPTVADDVIHAATSPVSMQIMLNHSHQYSVENKYNLHPDKGTITEFLNIKENTQFTLGENIIKTTDEFSHLGQVWQKGKSYPDVSKRIKAGTGAAYLLMGKKVHGYDGLAAAVCARILNVYVLPRLLYGLEAVVLPKSEEVRVGNAYLNLCKKIQGLPSRCSNDIAYLLLDIIPPEAILHTRCLTLFGAILRLDESSALKNVCMKNLGIDDKGSWFVMVRNVAAKYDIDINQQVVFPKNKMSWKRYVKSIVNNHWRIKMLNSAISKSSLRYVKFQYLINGKHPLHFENKGKPIILNSRAEKINRTIMI